MGRGQVVRQPVLTLLFGGSNPSAPVTGKKQQLKELARIPKYLLIPDPNTLCVLGSLGFRTEGLKYQVLRIPDAGSVPESVMSA